MLREAWRSGPRRIYCDARCRSRANYERAKADGRADVWAATSRLRARKPDRPWTCRWCGDIIVAPRPRVCCARDVCRRAAQADRTRPHVQRRRAARKSRAVEHFTDVEIFERDRWRCGICRRPVNRRLRHPHPRSASLDHIVPLIAGPGAGGVHARWNVQCAHLACNLAKCAAYEQGALF